MKSTRIKDWSLQDFLRSTAMDVATFLKSLRLLASHKKLEDDLKTFALKLRAYYSGPIGAKRVKIIKQNLVCEINRRVISGQEHLINQGKLESQLDQELSSTSSSGATTSSSDQLASSSDQLTSFLTPLTSELNANPSFRWQAEYDPKAGANVSATVDNDFVPIPGRTAATSPSAELDVEDGGDHEDVNGLTG
ncbi:hypothetical protein EC957_010426 [Mortierella hygrophila]|uniref:Uncharacterized protein n=1 Tax=Mortierella hygrophila TaxID=979708 RepID=A0A9P6EVV9_9FUNG|nr:hypothetical protein EC957_010426 [Mortierella hygrophila]